MIPIRFFAVLILALLLHTRSAAQIFADFETISTTPELQNGNARVVDNPDTTGINTSNKCAVYDKSAGNWHYMAMIFHEPVMFGSATTMSFKVHSSTLGRVYYKFWDGNRVVIESWAHAYHDRPAPGRWVELTMDISKAQGQRFTRLEIAAGVDNDAPATIYLDDFKLYNPLADEGIPVINLHISPDIIYTGSVVTFDASASFDWNALPLTYTWDFGDGSASAAGSTVTHTYDKPGLYRPSLLLTNTDGKASRQEATLFVFNPGQQISGLHINTATPKVYGKIEGIFQSSSTYSNPYDPDIVYIDAIITRPDQTKDTIPAFYYIRSNLTNGQWVNDSANAYWMIRFTSNQEGLHVVKLHLTDEAGGYVSDEHQVYVAPSNNKGFVYIDPDNQQYYRHSTGEHYLPIGNNVGWSLTSDKISEYHQHISALGNNGGNMLRYWTVTFASQSLEARNGYSYYKGIGNYSQQAAALLDSIFEHCASHDIQIMLTMWQHGILSENVNPNWDLNPYNTANGGFLEKPADFFGNERAKKLTRNLIRNYVARWGYSTHLFAWEFFNEVDLTGRHGSNPPSWVDDVDNWHEEMGAYIRSIDPYNHIRTTSVSGWMDHPLVAALGDNSQLDLYQFHSYGHDVTGAILDKYRVFKTKTDLPIMCGEFGKNELAESIDEFRNACWVGYFRHLPNLHWHWIRALEENFYAHFAPMADYFRDVDLVAEGNPTSFQVQPISDKPTVAAEGMKTDAGNHYFYVYSRSFADGIDNTRLRLNNMPFGYYQITWHDPVTGKVSAPDTIVVIRQEVDLHVPVFSKDLAAKLHFLDDYYHPIAIAGPDQRIPLGSTFTINGENSINPKGLGMTYAWELISQPEGSDLVINDPALVSLTFSAELAGAYLFSLIVSDI